MARSRPKTYWLMFQGRSSASIALAIYLSYVLCFALAPFTFHWDPGLSASELLEQRFEGMPSVWRVTWWDIWTNILFFLPFGWLLARLPVVTLLHPALTIALSLACAALVSLGIELAQMLLPRHPSLVDVGCNVVGALVGSMLSLVASPACRDRHMRPDRRRLPLKWIGGVTAGYWTALCFLFSFPLPLVADFSNWDSSLYLNVGNETTLSRPWRGTFYGLALYDRALSQEEIRTSFSAGPPDGPRRSAAANGALVNYDFSEGSGTMVLDRADSRSPVNLRIGDPSLVRWLTPNGLALLGSTGLSSLPGMAGPAQDKLSASGEMSLQVWVKPADSSQPGPNPFVSSSNRVDLRNFALAQDAGDLVFWLRTPLTGLNGRKMELRTVEQPLSTEFQHVVVTYGSSVAALYLNSVEQARMSLDKKQALLDLLVDLIGPYYEAGLQSVLLFPFGVLGYFSFSTLKPAWLPFAAALAGAAVVEAARALMLRHQIDPLLVAVAAGTVLIAGIAATRLVPAGHYRDPIGT